MPHYDSNLKNVKIKVKVYGVAGSVTVILDSMKIEKEAPRLIKK